MTSKMILLVEDSPDDEEMTVRTLRRHQIAIDVVVARDGAEALDYLFGQGAYTGRDVRTLPQLIILDLKLPKLDGLEVLRRIRGNERTKLVPVVIFTSSREEQDVVAGYRLGVNAYVRKPIDFNSFGEAVRQLGLFFLLLNEPAPPPDHE
jgi:two-component system response regulator